MSTSTITPATIQFASLKHRLICMIYEAVLLFGVFFASDLLFDVATHNFTQSLDETTLRHWRQLYLFFILGGYFTYFWRRSGQTLPMQTWHIKVASTDQSVLTFKRAALRYCGAWMWFIPALCINYLCGLNQWPALIVVMLGIIAWALTSKLDENGQFLHDKLAGTQIIAVPKKSSKDDHEK